MMNRAPFKKKQHGKKEQHGKKNQRGVAMIEVLVAFFVLAIGLMGLIGMQMKALRFNQGAYQRSQATVSVYDMIDRMRLNSTAAVAKNYNISWASTATAGTSVVSQDLSAWLTSVSGNLPEGQGQITCDNNKICKIEVRWRDRLSTETNSANAAYWDQIVISTEI